MTTPDAEVNKIENELRFKIVEESWNSYELGDESTLKARVVLGKVIKGKDNEVFCDVTPPFFVVSAPNNKRGPQDNEPMPEEFSSIEKEAVKILSSDEKWNEYETVDVKFNIKIKYTVSNVTRLKGRFNKYGFPFYLITGVPAITINPIST